MTRGQRTVHGRKYSAKARSPYRQKGASGLRKKEEEGMAGKWRGESWLNGESCNSSVPLTQRLPECVGTNNEAFSWDCHGILVC